MDMILLGQLLLGALAAVAVLVIIQLVRLGRRHRGQPGMQTPLVAALLRWLPLAVMVIVAGGVALGEISLLGYHAGQDVNGLSWFVVGACFSIFADMCAAMTWITLREALKMTEASDDLAAALSALAAQDISSPTQQDEP
ncbi:MAG TPA: hypothetical protein VH590_16755 [Ktedonobacterales bacterium]|jgi:hypothetical protein